MIEHALVILIVSATTSFIVTRLILKLVFKL